MWGLGSRFKGSNREGGMIVRCRELGEGDAGEGRLLLRHACRHLRGKCAFNLRVLVYVFIYFLMGEVPM